MSDLSSERIQALLLARRIGRPCLYFDAVGSTNDVAHHYGREGAAEGLVVLADEQTAGRGRLDRRWWAPPGSSLLMSLLLRPNLPISRAAQLTMCLGLAAVEGIVEVTALEPLLKWPNDLLLHGRKLGGMLSEMQAVGDVLEYVVLGMGINVNLPFGQAWREALPNHPDSVPPAGLADSAISLSDALGSDVDRAVLLASILLRFEAWYDVLLSGSAGESSLKAAWAARLETLGKIVVITMEGITLRGRAVGVTSDGALLVEDDGGRLHSIWSGDVTSLHA